MMYHIVQQTILLIKSFCTNERRVTMTKLAKYLAYHCKSKSRAYNLLSAIRTLDLRRLSKQVDGHSVSCCRTREWTRHQSSSAIALYRGRFCTKADRMHQHKQHRMKGSHIPHLPKMSHACHSSVPVNGHSEVSALAAIVRTHQSSDSSTLHL